jgi:hypothetical protein
MSKLVLIGVIALMLIDDCACSAGGWRGEIIIKRLKETFKSAR